MSLVSQSQRFVGRVSATLELTCPGHECANITELLQIQPTWTSPLLVTNTSGPPSPSKNGCAWHYESAPKVSSTDVSDHIQHLLLLFLPIKSRIEEMRPVPQIDIILDWECSGFGVTGLTGPQFTVNDLRGLTDLGARLQIKV